MAKTTTTTLHRCGDCANCTTVTDVHRLLSIRGRADDGHLSALDDEPLHAAELAERLPALQAATGVAGGSGDNEE